MANEKTSRERISARIKNVSLFYLDFICIDVMCMLCCRFCLIFHFYLFIHFVNVRYVVFVCVIFHFRFDTSNIHIQMTFTTPTNQIFTQCDHCNVYPFFSLYVSLLSTVWIHGMHV